MPLSAYVVRKEKSGGDIWSFADNDITILKDGAAVAGGVVAAQCDQI